MAFEGITTPFEVPDTDTVYVANLAPNATEADLAEYFGSIGIIKIDKKTRKPKIWLYRDKQTGELKGDGTVSYEDPFAAGSAVSWFDQKEFKGSILHVSLAKRRDNDHYHRGYDDNRMNFDGGHRRNYDPRPPREPPLPPRQEPLPPPIREAAPPPRADPNLYLQRNAVIPSREPDRPTPPIVSIEGGPEEGGATVNRDFGQAGQQQYGMENQYGQLSDHAQPPGWEPQGKFGNDQGFGGAPYGFSGHQPQGYEQADQGYAQGCSGKGHQGQSGPGLWGMGNDLQGAAGRGRGRGAPLVMDGEPAGRGGGKKVVAAPQGPPGLFGPEDWPCPSCGNTNWARRPRCNLCGAPKPGTVDMKREGQAGGFKELDEKEIEEAKRRRREQDEDDEELYDDYGRVKKKYRSDRDRAAREAAALARLRGDYDPSPSGQEQMMLQKGKLEEKKRDASSNKERDKDSSKPRKGNESRDRDRGTKDKDRDHEKDHGRGKDRDKDRERDKERSKDRDRDRDRRKDHRR